MPQMAKPTDYPGFKMLEATWYQRLAETGFHDIEYEAQGGPGLERPRAEWRGSRIPESQVTAKTVYFDIVSERVAETQFPNEVEKSIMTLYAEGRSQIEIQLTLNLDGHRCQVYRPIHKWLKNWGLK